MPKKTIHERTVPGKPSNHVIRTTVTRHPKETVRDREYVEKCAILPDKKRFLSRETTKHA